MGDCMCISENTNGNSASNENNNGNNASNEREIILLRPVLRTE